VGGLSQPALLRGLADCEAGHLAKHVERSLRGEAGEVAGVKVLGPSIIAGGGATGGGLSPVLGSS